MKETKSVLSAAGETIKQLKQAGKHELADCFIQLARFQQTALIRSATSAGVTALLLASLTLMASLRAITSPYHQIYIIIGVIATLTMVGISVAGFIYAGRIKKFLSVAEPGD